MKLTLGFNNCGRLAACTPKLAKAGCEAAPIQHRTDWLWRTGRQLQDKIDIYFRRVSVRGRNVGMTGNAMYGCALQNASFEITTIRRRLTDLPHSVRTPAALRPEMKVPIPRSL